MDSLTVQLISWLQSTAGIQNRWLFDFFSELGGPTGWLLVSSLVFWISGSRNGIRVGLVISISALLNTWLKWLIAAPRPYYLHDEVQAIKASDGLGMPSGHSQGVTALWASVIYLFQRFWLLAVGLIFIVMTGAARIYYGVHPPFQVVAGWSLGIAVVLLVLSAEAPVVAWLAGKSLGQQLSAIAAAGVALSLIGLVISMLIRGDFQPPHIWVQNFQLTAERISLATGEEADPFILIDAMSSISVVCYLLGYALCGIYVLNTGQITPVSVGHMCLNIALGIPLLVLCVVLFIALEAFTGDVIADVLRNLTVPIVAGILLPQSTQRFFQRSSE